MTCPPSLYVPLSKCRTTFERVLTLSKILNTLILTAMLWYAFQINTGFLLIQKDFVSALLSMNSVLQDHRGFVDRH